MVVTNTIESCDIAILNTKHEIMDNWVKNAEALISETSHLSKNINIDQSNSLEIDENTLATNIRNWQQQYKEIHDDNMDIDLSDTNLFNEIVLIDNNENNMSILENTIENTEIIQADYVAKKFSLNVAQTLVFKLFIEALFILTIFQRLIYMGGEGGTGKTRVIQAIMYYFLVNNKRNQLLIGAPTGSAACLINGETIHRLLKLSITD